MENNRITHQYEPGFLHNIVELESLDDRAETTEKQEVAIELLPDEPTELVDFYMTPSAVESLKVIVTWSKVLVVSMVFFSIIEIAIFALLAIFKHDFLPTVLPMLRSLASLSINVWLILQIVQFNKKMSQAIRYNDNTALADAFLHQAVYFKWVFYSILVTVVFSFFKIF
ncbi:MAG: hypothetical protein Q8K92_26545 [Leadbetterella sp.]|nr:hypothetical protein [Leadbetterella sp.]